MVSKCFKSLLVAAFGLSCLVFPTGLKAQGGAPKTGQEDSAAVPPAGEAGASKEEGKMNPSRIILEHVADGHEFHFFTIGKRLFTLPLPVILYSPAPGKGWSVFMSSAFEHGRAESQGYRLLDEEFIKEHKLDEVKDAKGKPVFTEGKVYPVDAAGLPDPVAPLYDLSLTRNAVQVLISVLLLVWLMTGIAGQYAKGEGVKTAPTGFQNAIEPVITFVRDEVGKPNLGPKYEKYMPFLLTIFFFILINALIGLIPGTANVTGNIAFTAVLGILAFVAILFSSNRHYWAHIVNPSVPIFVKPIMIPVEIMGLFTKPFALIIRLFANMISGHIIILSFICLIFIFGAMNTGLGWGTSPFFILLTIFIYLLEILVAFIQAFIFANLTAIFIGQAFEGSHHKEGEHGHDDTLIV